MSAFLLAIAALIGIAAGGVALFEEGRALGQREGLRIPCAQHSPPVVRLRLDCEEALRTCRARTRTEKVK